MFRALVFLILYFCGKLSDDILNIRVTNLYMEMMKTTYQLGTCAGACTPCILCLESVCEGLKKKQNE